jgi:hypothetical protein
MKLECLLSGWKIWLNIFMLSTSLKMHYKIIGFIANAIPSRPLSSDKFLLLHVSFFVNVNPHCRRFYFSQNPVYFLIKLYGVEYSIIFEQILRILKSFTLYCISLSSRTSRENKIDIWIFLATFLWAFMEKYILH